MSQILLDNSDTMEAGVVMYATQVEHEATHVTEKLVQLIEQKQEQERFLILTDNNAARSTMRALLGKKIKSCIFVMDMCDEESLIEEEQHNFDRLKVAVCSYEAYQKIELQLVENYTFVGFPAKRTLLSKSIDTIESSAENENRLVRIDFVVPTGQPPEMLKILQMEMKTRKGDSPLWLAEAVIMHFAAPQRQAGLLEAERRSREQPLKIIHEKKPVDDNGASDTSGSPVTSFSNVNERSPAQVQVQSRSLKTVRPVCDLSELKPNEKGEYIVPRKAICYGESDDDDDDFYTEENMSYEGEYDYEGGFEHDYDDEHSI